MKGIKNVLNVQELRQKAERVAERIPGEALEAMTLPDIKKLIQELQVYHVELEVQNEHYLETTVELQKVAQKFEKLYERAPVGYLTLNKKTAYINECNLQVVQLLDIEKSMLLDKSFVLWIAEESRNTYYAFLKAIFDTPTKHTCEVYLQPKKEVKLWVRLEGVEVKKNVGQERYCQVAIIDLLERKQTEEELDRQLRLRTAELEHTNALLRAEIEQHKLWQEIHEPLIAELKNRLASNEAHQTDHINSTVLSPKDSTYTQQEILQMKLKHFCDTHLEQVYGSRFWRYVVNSKKSYEPTLPMHELMEYTVHDFVQDVRCKLRIRKQYNNETFEKAMEGLAKYKIYPFG